MFGSHIDYHLLRPLTHARGLQARPTDTPAVTDKPQARLQKLIDRLGGRLPLAPDKRYLDIGCGPGDLTLALARASGGLVTGIDVVQRYIDRAREDATREGLTERARFCCTDIHDWDSRELFDVILSHEALEHIRDVRGLLNGMARRLRPGGSAILAFGPLFYSPVGDHMDAFFRIKIPWRGALFSEQALLRLRRERFRPDDAASRYQDITGSLNMMRYSEFLAYVAETGWEFRFLSVNPQLSGSPWLQGLSNVAIRIPVVRDYIATSVYAVLARPVERRQRPRSMPRPYPR
jgi:SAM-dependent methyltransferase